MQLQNGSIVLLIPNLPSSSTLSYGKILLYIIVEVDQHCGIYVDAYIFQLDPGTFLFHANEQQHLCFCYVKKTFMFLAHHKYSDIFVYEPDHHDGLLTISSTQRNKISKYCELDVKIQIAKNTAHTYHTADTNVRDQIIDLASTNGDRCVQIQPCCINQQPTAAHKKFISFIHKPCERFTRCDYHK